jgi:hypothetical protein
VRLSLSASVAAMTAVLTLTGCGAGPNPWSTPTSSAGARDHIATALVPLSPEKTAGPTPVAEPGSTAPSLWAELPILEQVWRADPPRGTGPEIALRFLRALQRGDDVAADRELYVFGRQQFSPSGMWLLHRVMSDVRRNAGLAQAGRCTRTGRLAKESAVVTCGRIHVVVHVLADDLAHGVQISDWHVHHDVFRGPHTHAFTTFQL